MTEVQRVPASLLVVDDDEIVARLLLSALAAFGDARWVPSAEEALAAIAREVVDVVVTDLSMPGMDGLELCRRIVELRPDVPVVVVTSHGRLDAAVGAIRAGAYDFITKPPDVVLLALAIERALHHRRLRGELTRLRTQPGVATPLPGVIGESARMREVYDLVARVGPTDATVLVTGESGTGKENVARAIHEASGRKGRFVAINCAAMPESLLEAELFGHARGAFTDARTARDGLFMQADEGTLFLDEIGEMPLGLQPKLLRALQEKMVRPIGATADVPVRVRIVAATNRDLEQEVAEKRFREDLFFRIHVVEIALPPLRARGNDVLLLATHFLASFSRELGRAASQLDPAVAERLLSYPWPGNVRELQNCIQRGVALMRFDRLTVDDLPEKIRGHRPAATSALIPDDPTAFPTMDEVERRYVLRVLEALGGNKTAAARALGIERKTLYRKLEKYGVA